MSRPWSPQEVEERLERGIEALEEATLAYGDLTSRAADAKATYEVETAKAMLRSRAEEPKAAEWVHRAKALVACDELRFSRDMAEAVAVSQKQAIETIRSRVEALRTLLVQARSSLEPRRY